MVMLISLFFSTTNQTAGGRKGEKFGQPWGEEHCDVPTACLPLNFQDWVLQLSERGGEVGVASGS